MTSDSQAQPVSCAGQGGPSKPLPLPQPASTLVCRDCGRDFTSQLDLDVHILEGHGLQEGSTIPDVPEFIDIETFAMLQSMRYLISLPRSFITPR